MPTESEMTAAYDYLPYVRAQTILDSLREFTDDEVCEWLRWAYKKIQRLIGLTT